jgi:DNA gyrase/topoisomerase IV subunit A
MFRDGHLVQTSVSEIIDYHYDKRYELYRTRVEYQKNQLKTDIKELEQKMKFIQVCIDGKIPLTTSTNVELLQACMEQNVNEKYLDMNLRDLTKDKVGKLKASIAKRKKDWDTLNATPVVDIWLRELNALERCIVPSKKKRDFIDLSD